MVARLLLSLLELLPELTERKSLPFLIEMLKLPFPQK
jgi:hypothetical protein